MICIPQLLAFVLSCICPVLHASCPGSLLSYISLVMYLSCHVSLLSCTSPVMHLSCPHRWWWWLIGSAPDFWGRGPGFESGISHNDPDALPDHCVIMYILRVERVNLPLRPKRSLKKSFLSWISPVLHASCHVSLLPWISTVLHASCHVSLLPWISPVLHASCHVSFLSWISPVRHFSCPASHSYTTVLAFVLSCICPVLNLKGVCHEIFYLHFFHFSNPSRPPIKGLKYFWITFGFCIHILS